MVWKTFVALALIASSTAGHAQVVLWRTLQSGEAPASVEAKLKAMPEIKAVKTKLRGSEVREQDINMKEGGIPIHEGQFSVVTAYKGLGLERVQLESRYGCANGVYPFASKIAASILEKYPNVIRPLPDELAFTSAAYDANKSYSSSIGAVYGNGQTVVIVTMVFQYINPPVYTSGALGNAIYQIARMNYERESDACGGGLLRRGAVQLTYVSQDLWDNGIAEEIEAQEQAKKQAAENL